MLLASLQDLELEGLPAAATASVAASRLRALQAASDEAAGYLRGRYTFPLIASVETVEKLPVTASTGTGTISAATTSSIGQAYGVRLEVLSTGGSGVATARVSIDSGQTWQATFTISSGTRTITLSSTESLVLTFDSGTWYDGDFYYTPVRYPALTSHVVAIASWKLLMRRGFDPDSAAYDGIKTAYKDALQWLKDVRDNRTDPGLTDSTGSTDEGGFVFEPSMAGDGDRGWEAAMGRSARTASSSTTSTGDSW